MTSDTLGQLRRVASRSTIFTASDLLQLGIAFLLIPLYTRFLTPADYGVLSVATTIGGVLSIFYLQSIEGAYTRFHYDFSDDRLRRRFFGSLWLFHAAWATALTAVLEIAGRWSPAARFVSVPFDPHLRLVIWTTFLATSTLLLPRAIFLVREQAWRYAGLNLLLFSLCTGSIVYFVVARGEGAAGSLKGSLLGTAAVAVLAVVIALRNIDRVLEPRHVRNALAFSLPLAPHLLSLWALSLADRLILQHYATLDAVGVYTLGYQLGSIPQIVALGVSTALDPFYFKIASTRPDAPAVLAPLTTWYLLLLTWIGVGTVILAPAAIALVGARPGYFPAVSVVPWVVLGSIARGFYFVFLAAILYSKRVRALPFITAAMAVLNVGLNLVLIPRFGILAAAVTTFVAYAVQAVLMYVWAQRAYRLEYQWGRLTLLIGAGLAWVAAASALPSTSPALEIVSRGALTLLFPAGLLVFGFFPAAERRTLWRFVSAK